MFDLRIASMIIFYAFVGSVFLAELIQMYLPLAYLALLLAVAVLLLMFLLRAGPDVLYIYTAVFFISFSVLPFYLQKEIDAQVQTRQVFDDLLHRHVSFNAEVVDDIDKREDKIFIILKICKANHCAKAKAKYYGHKELRYGDELVLTGSLETPDTFSEHFDYPDFLRSQDILYTLRIHDITQIKHHDSWLAQLYNLKHTTVAHFYQVFSYDSAALASGINLGEKQALGEGLKNTFMRSGLMHIVVLSGYNITVLAGFVFLILSFINKRWRAVLAIFVVGIFVIMIGADAPSLRAGIMGSVGFMAIVLRRESDALYALFISGIVMLLIHPLAVVYNPGFQMSFVATLAIVLFSDGLMERLHFAGSTAAELISSTVLAYVSVTPLIVYYMGQLSFLSIIANFLALPLVPFAMLLSLVATVIDILAPPLAFLPVAGAELLLSTIIKIATLFGGEAWTLTDISMPFYMLVLFYLSFAIVVFYKGVRRFAPHAFAH